MLHALVDHMKVQGFAGTHAAALVPTSYVQLYVMIKKHLLEVSGSVSPVLVEVLTQVGGNELSSSISNEPSLR